MMRVGTALYSGPAAASDSPSALPGGRLELLFLPLLLRKLQSSAAALSELRQDEAAASCESQRTASGDPAFPRLIGTFLLSVSLLAHADAGHGLGRPRASSTLSRIWPWGEWCR